MQQKHLIPHVNFYSCHKWCFRYIFVILFAFDFVVKSLGFVIHQEIMYLCRNKFWNIELLFCTWWAKIYTSEKYVASFVLWVKTPWSCSKRASFEVANVPWCDAILPPFHAFIPAHHISPSQRKKIIRYLFIHLGGKG